MSLFGAIEAGGTKFVCGVGTGPGDLRTAQIPTTTNPEATIARVIEYFRAEAGGALTAIGIGSFGPIDLNPASPCYGQITSTPKTGWRNYDLLGALRSGLGVPAGFDTDVNAAALAEARWGAARGLTDFVYLTVGTGIGGGALAGGRLLHGLLHPEMGHIRVPRDPARDPFAGVCPYHGDCLEGLAAGPAIQARWGTPAHELPPEHPAWKLEAHYLAMGLANLVYTLSPRRFALGGGVMRQAHLFPLIRRELGSILNGYVQAEEIMTGLDEYIVPPQLGNRAGVLGALALAKQAVEY